MIHLQLAARAGKIDESLRDQYEINMLSGIQDQRGFLHRVDKRNKAGIDAIANGRRPGMPEATTPTTSANTSTATEDDLAINNRCTWITYNQDAPREEIRETVDKRPLPSPDPSPSPVPSTFPWWLLPALLAFVALALITGAIWWALTHQTPVVIPPPNPQQNWTEWMEIK